VRVDFSVISLLYAEHEVDTATAQDIRLDTKIPSRNLEAMENVCGNFIERYIFIHDITHIFHLKLVVTVRLHEALLKEYFLIKEAFITS